MLAKVGLTKNDVEAQAVGPANVWKLFLAGKADAMASVPDFTGDVIEGGGKGGIIPADDYLQGMAQVVVASDRAIEAEPDKIRRLVRVTMKGVRAEIAEPAGGWRD